MRADKVTWNRKTGQIVASGNVRMVDEDGNQLYTDRVELTDELARPARWKTCCSRCAKADRAWRRSKASAFENGNIVLDTRRLYRLRGRRCRNGCPKKPELADHAVR